MDLEHWYRCAVCGYLYTPQQVVALTQLEESRSAGEGTEGKCDAIHCRMKGCEGTLVPTDQLHPDSHD